MQKTLSLLFDGFFLVLLAAAVATAWQWPFATGLFPLTIAIPVSLVAAAQFAKDAFFQGGQNEDSGQRERIRDIEVDRSVPARLVVQRAGTFYLCALGFLAAILLIGFKLSVPLFMVFYFRRFSRAGWPVTLILTGLLTGLVLGLFDAILHVGWPDNLLGHVLDRWKA
ncbi:MAG: tripartite tricarboxylate transporter TctB family protein [Deltaproteobacteria bacterium]|nr:tripartite tricarboxylate transporter TctB family protein [Deltaproteobacteria bacterium]